MKDRKGEKIKWKEFFKRWKDGIETMTPKQQIKAVLWGYWILILGIVW